MLTTLAVVLLLLLSPLVLVILASESTSSVTAVATADTNTAVRAKSIARKLRSDLKSDKEEASISISQQDLNGLIAFAMRGIDGFQGRVNATPLGIEGAFSVHILKNPINRYLNIRFGVDPSTNGLHLNYISIGSLSFSGDSALDIGESLLNLLAGDSLGSHLRRSIKSVTVTGEMTKVVYRPIPDLKQRLTLFKERAKEMRDTLALVADPEIVRVYYSQLCKLGEDARKVRKVSLGYYLAEAFSLAAKRSSYGGDPIAENRAALMAIAIYAGSTRFESFVGEVITDDLAHCVSYSKNTQLAKRSDLRLHFIYSAAIKVLGDSGSSFALGEFKEMMDSGRGGSGFSFADLAADKAGIRFAEIAMDSKSGSALKLQSIAASLTDETQFFPDISGLPEGISQTDFDGIYGGIEGAAYLEVVGEIERRLEKIALYNFDRAEY